MARNVGQLNRHEITNDKSAYRQLRNEPSDNGVLYEQVADVNVFLIRVFAVVVAFVVAFVVALHRVCIRTLMSRMNRDSVPVGVREESRCCHLSDGLGRPKRRRSHRNAVSMQLVNSIRPAGRTARMVAVWSRGDEARRQACGPPPRRTCSSPASLRALLGAGPTVEAPSLDHGVSGCG